jgi:hypothetical protein
MKDKRKKRYVVDINTGNPAFVEISIYLDNSYKLFGLIMDNKLSDVRLFKYGKMIDYAEFNEVDTLPIEEMLKKYNLKII